MGTQVPIDHAEQLREVLRRFAGKEVYFSSAIRAPAMDVESEVKSILERLRRIRQRLVPGTFGGKPDIVRRWMSAPGTANPQRRADWALSRACLADVLEEAFSGPEIHSGSVTIHASLTHAGDFAAAAAAFAWSDERLRNVGLGLDAEPANRGTSPKIAGRIAHPDDKLNGLDLLAVWTAKEACLKADPSGRSQLSAYALMCYRDPDEDGPLQAFGDRLDFRIWTGIANGYRIALALAYPGHPLAVVQDRAE